MSSVIIFCGLPGTGKSTLAKAVARKMNIVSLHKDVFKESLYELVQGETLDDSKTTGRYAVGLLLAVAEDVVQNNVDVIIESPFNHPDNVRLFQAWEEKGAMVSIIVCTVDEKERLKRTKNRERHVAHHEAARPAGLIGSDSVDYQIFPEPKIFLDTNQPVEILVEKVKEFLEQQ